MPVKSDLPDDFQACVRFHGHVCPGLAIGYGAVGAAKKYLEIDRAPDEEIVAVVENDSCAVDAVQVLLGCTFGKGNLIFNDWGKQVFTFISRKTGQAIRVSFVGPVPGYEERHALKEKFRAGQASSSDAEKLRELNDRVARDLIGSAPELYFDVLEVKTPMPPLASVVQTQPCDTCGEATVVTKMVEKNGRLICKGCAAEQGQQ